MVQERKMWVEKRVKVKTRVIEIYTKDSSCGSKVGNASHSLHDDFQTSSSKCNDTSPQHVDSACRHFVKIQRVDTTCRQTNVPSEQL